MKISTTNINDFCRWFRKKVRDEVVDTAVKQRPQLRQFIFEVFPKFLFYLIQKWERNTSLGGVTKMTRVTGEVWQFLSKEQAVFLLPFLRSTIELSVMHIYREYFMSKLKKHGVHDVLEKLLKVDLDDDGDIGEPDKEEKKEPVEVKPPPTPVKKAVKKTAKKKNP